MAHRLSGWTAIEYAERHGGTLKKFRDPTERALKRVSIAKAKDVAREDSRLIYMDVPHSNTRAKNPAKSVRLRNFSGTIRVNPNKTVSVLGKGKRGTAAKRRKR